MCNIKMDHETYWVQWCGWIGYDQEGIECLAVVNPVMNL